jgi:hypothetical protein
MKKSIKIDTKKANSRFETANSFKIMPVSKRSQVAIFIILALIIVVSISLLFLLFKGPEATLEDVENPSAYISSCVKEFTGEAIEIISKNGGDIEPEGSLMYKGENITYLCYTANYYKTCVNQRPMLIEHVEDEIKNYIEPKVTRCFNSLQSELEKKDYVVNTAGMSLDVSLKPKQVVVDIKKSFKMIKGEKSQEFKEFKVNTISPIYELSEIAMEIANQESYYCNFENLGFMIIYPEYDIRKERVGDSDTIYNIKEIRTNKNFRFAIRSCALPPGL